MEKATGARAHENASYYPVRFCRERTQNPDPNDFRHHCHESYELFYLIEGEGTYIVEDAVYPLYPHLLLLIPPREYHHIHLTGGHAYERCVINFETDALPTLGGRYACLEEGDTTRLYRSREVYTVLPSLFERMQECAVSGNERSMDMQRLILGEILLTLSLLSPEKDAAVKPLREEPLGARVIRYLNRNLTTPISLDELAGHFFVSKFHLARAFKERNGISVMEYLTRKRILLAKALIMDGESASNAAYRVGFGDYSTFFRAYKKITGCSPTEQTRQRKEAMRTL